MIIYLLNLSILLFKVCFFLFRDQNENLDTQTPTDKTKDFLKLRLDCNKSNSKLSGKSMNSIYDNTNKYSNENLYQNTRLNSASLTNVEWNNKITDSKSQTDLYKKASYQKPIAKDALKTSLKNLNKENESNNIMNDLTLNTNAEPVSTTKTMTTSKTTNDNSDITTTTTITTKKTIVKQDDINRKRNLCRFILFQISFYIYFFSFKNKVFKCLFKVY